MKIASPLRILPWLLGVLAVMHAGPARAQFTGDYETNIISGTTVDWTGTYAVGSNTSYDFLGIDSGGTLISDAGGIGIDGDGSGNDAVSVSGIGSVWSNRNDLTIGYSNTSQYNSLTILNGGAVYDNNCSVAGDFNAILVSGNGSAWNNSGSITMGGAMGQAGNSITIANGGVVSDDSFSTGNGGNSMLVMGPGSVWSNRNNFSLDSELGDSLVISNGGAVYDQNGTAASHESVLVSGSGSIWNNRNSLSVGGISSSLTISNGGAVYSASALVSGLGPSLVITGPGSVWQIGGLLRIISDQGLIIADEGVVSATSVEDGVGIIVSGGGLYVTNGLGTSVLSLSGGSVNLNNGTVTVDSLVDIENFTSFNFNGGTVNTKGTTISNGVTFVVGDGVDAAIFKLDTGGLGFHSFANGLSISSNAVLKGNGTIVGNTAVIAGGMLAPRTSSITFSNSLTLAPSSTFEVELNGTATSQYDRIVTLSAVSISNSVLSLSLGYTPSAGDTFTIISNLGPSAAFGQFVDTQGDVLTNTATFMADGTTFEISYAGNVGGQDVTLTVVVPEPSAWFLTALGCGGLGVMGWQTRSEA